MIYKVQMSRGDDIKIDDDDLKKIKANIAESLIQVKQGIINPSFLISITPTDEPDVVIKPEIEMRDGRPILVGRGTVKKLADKMSMTKLLENKKK